MWRKYLIALTLTFFALFLSSSTVMAASPSGTVTMNGQATVVQNGYSSQLRLKVESSGPTRWLLEIALSPQSVAYNSNSKNQVINIVGSYTLGSSEQAVSSGTVSGWWNTGGYGEINLTDQANSVALNVSFTVSPDAAVTAQIQGQWPSVPGSASTSTSASTSGASQPTNNFFWYLSRTAAILAYMLLFINIVLGIGLHTKSLDRISARRRNFDMHQFTAMLAMGMIALHIFSLLLDNYYHFSLKDLLVPMSSPYRPTYVTFGVAGLYMLLIIALCSYFRRFIGNTAWRVIHSISYILFFIVLFHGIKAGTDSSAAWTQWMYIITGTTVVFLFLWRHLIAPKDKAGQQEQGKSQQTKVA